MDHVRLDLEGMPLDVVKQAVRRHKDWLLRQRKALDGVVPGAVYAIDQQLEVVREQLTPALGLEEEDESPRSDPEQLDIEDAIEPDLRTHAFRHVKQTRELVSQIIDSSPRPAAAVMALNRLEDGEKQRPGGGRENHLEVIRDARQPLTRRVKPLVENGGEVAA